MLKWLLPILMVLAAFWLTGCSPTYSKFGVTVDEWNRDAYECSYQAQALPRTPQTVMRGAMGNPVYSDPSMGLFDVAASRQMLDLCMKARGYTRE